MRVLSLFQPLGRLHLGNYLGAIAQWRSLQSDVEADRFFGIATLHTLTTRPTPESLRTGIEQAKRWLVALLDIDNCVLFDQAAVPEHAELGWIITCLSNLGELERMTQFKDKSKRPAGTSVPTGLLVYPSLMCADILLYKATHIPVGNDQDQHLELAASLSRRFAQIYSRVFPTPRPLHSETPRIMSLTDPSRKMSKSEPGGCIFLDDSNDEIRKKVCGAVTDSGGGDAPGPRNLVYLLQAIGGDEEATRFSNDLHSGKIRYGALKDVLSTHLVNLITPLRERYLETSPTIAGKILIEGSEQARHIANGTIREVRRAVGISR